MAKKRGGRKQVIKISTSSNLLNKKNIIFMLILVLLLIMIIYFAIKTWPIMQQRLGDEDDDGVKNYEDKCANTPKGSIVDSYGCEMTEEKIHRESPIFIGQDEDDETEEDTSVVCSEDDDGKNIWIKGICNDGSEKTDSCKINFEEKLYEYECLNNICVKHSIDCGDYNALCYDGRCIDKNKDSDNDGYPDLDEYEADTDPFNEDSYPGAEPPSTQGDCNSKCIGLGYVSGRGPFDSFGHCNYPEVGKYLTSSTAGDVCCCTPADEGTDDQQNGDEEHGCWESDGGNKPYVAGYTKFIGLDEEYNDVCRGVGGDAGSDVKEYYCMGNALMNELNPCEYGCEEVTIDGRVLGRCKEATPPPDVTYSTNLECVRAAGALGFPGHELSSSDWTFDACLSTARTECGGAGISHNRDSNCCMWRCWFSQNLFAPSANPECNGICSGSDEFWYTAPTQTQCSVYVRHVCGVTSTGMTDGAGIYTPDSGCCCWDCFD